jgi:hypothetical protein
VDVATTSSVSSLVYILGNLPQTPSAKPWELAAPCSSPAIFSANYSFPFFQPLSPHSSVTSWPLNAHSPPIPTLRPSLPIVTSSAFLCTPTISSPGLLSHPTTSALQLLSHTNKFQTSNFGPGLSPQLLDNGSHLGRRVTGERWKY